MTSTPVIPVPLRKINTPKFSIITAVLLIALAITAVVIGSITKTDITPIMGFIALAIPALLSSAFAERNSNDLRNGVVQEKSQQGAMAALHSSGLMETTTQVASALLESKGTSNVAMQALARLLEINTTATETNTLGQNGISSKSAQVIPVPDKSIIVTPIKSTPESSPIPAPQTESAGGKTNG